MINKIKTNKVASLIVVTLIYILAIVGGYFSAFFINDNIYIKFFFADVIATIIIWIFSLIFKNSSMYDAYWSLIPWVIVSYFLVHFKCFDIYSIILYLAFSFWSMRLTINWAITFDNLNWEDWRYTNYRNNLNPFFFHIANFFGIHMMPTVLVYGGTLPILVLYSKFASSSSPLILIGAFIIILGTMLELFSDHQMHSFLRNTKERKTCDNGLWKYSRHPNYLGEILIWIGAFVALIVIDINYWYLAYGFILMILLFEFISIPMAEKRHKGRRSDYVDYIKHTSRLILLPRRK